MPSFFLNFNVLRSQAQLKGWSTRPDVPLGSSSSRWRKKNSKASSSKPSPPPSPTTATTTAATASSSSRTQTDRSSSIKPSTSSTPTTASSRGSVSWTGSTTNVLLIHPLCRCCTDVVNSITRPIRRAPKVTATTTTTTNSSSGGSSSTTATTGTTGTTTTAAGSTGRKPTWDGFPSTQYMRLWPQPDEETLWEAKFRPERSRLAAPALPDPPKKKQTKKQRSWKFWPTSIL